MRVTLVFDLVLGGRGGGFGWMASSLDVTLASAFSLSLGEILDLFGFCPICGATTRGQLMNRSDASLNEWGMVFQLDGIDLI